MTVLPTPTPTSTMRAITHDRFGSADVLHLRQIPRPEPKDGEVLLRVHSAGVDRAAWHMMTGRPYLARLAFGFRTPRSPALGIEVAGTVDAVGAAVTRFADGDEVYGFARGSFADYAVAREDRLAYKPVNLSFQQASVVPVSAATALQALTDSGRAQPGQTVLVIGASGGVGSYAVQIAKALGAEVTGVASTGKLDLVRALGADHVLDYTRDDFADDNRRYDLVIDLAGNPTLSRLRRALTPTGTAVITGGEEGGSFSGGMNRQLRAVAWSPFLRQRLTMFIAKQRSSDLDRLSILIESGNVTPSIDRSYPLQETADAMRYLAAGHARGKVAISI
jgi:NADPH:quinone reductase-like Zn-dependent oxidoreductase